MGEEVEELLDLARDPIMKMTPHEIVLEVRRLRASLTRAQYTCEAHASEVLKGGECVWCTLTRVEEERDARGRVMNEAIDLIRALKSPLACFKLEQALLSRDISTGDKP